MSSGGSSDPVLSPELLERVLEKLGLARPSHDLQGLNALYAAFCKGVPADNVMKRIWFAGDKTGPLPGADPKGFFEDWLKHGTGGTCFPINGAMGALVQSLGFDARRIAGMIIVGERAQSANHGTVIVTLDGVDYLVDAQIGSFKALPLVGKTSSSTGEGVLDLQSVPFEDRLEVRFFNVLAVSPQEFLTFRPEPQYDPVDHAFFCTAYELTVTNSPFNHALFACRRLPGTTVTLRPQYKIVVSNNNVARTEISGTEQKRVLVEEFGVSEEMAEALPPDDPAQ